MARKQKEEQKRAKRENKEEGREGEEDTSETKQQQQEKREKRKKLRQEKAEASLMRVVLLSMNEAMIRHCPSCGLPCIKDGGCNHIKCPCGHHYCYSCRQSMPNQKRPYSHFGQPPTFCRQRGASKEEDRAALVAAAKEAEKTWRMKHPKYKGKGIDVEELVRQVERTTN